jgi:hypothetical protein
MAYQEHWQGRRIERQDWCQVQNGETMNLVSGLTSRPTTPSAPVPLSVGASCLLECTRYAMSAATPMEEFAADDGTTLGLGRVELLLCQVQSASCRPRDDALASSTRRALAGDVIVSTPRRQRQHKHCQVFQTYAGTLRSSTE